MRFRRALVGGALALSIGMEWAGLSAGAQQNPIGLVKPQTAKVMDVFMPLQPEELQIRGGMLGARLDANEKQRLLHVDENDLLDAFERRNVPHQDWQGEHVGKFLHAATLMWNYSRDPALKQKLERVVARLLKTQEADGYLGTYSDSKRWTSWDVWVHKYDLLGLLTYYQFTHNVPALKACRRIGDLLIRTFGTESGQRDINRAGEHMGMAADSVLEPVVLLYRATNEPRYLKFARYIVANYDAPGGPAVLASLEKYHSVRHVANAKAYEMVSNFNGLLELYRATGNRRYLDAMQTGWNDIVKNRLYLTGGASSGELFQDDYHLPNGENANICETCVTVTWEQMNFQLLRLTGEARYADQAERSIYNHLLGAQKPTGDMWSYYTPLEGHKPYGNSTNCCLSSGPRGVALIPAFMYMKSPDGGLAINLYNTSTTTTTLKTGRVRVEQQTDYPVSGTITVLIRPENEAGQSFPLHLRIPAWATDATLRCTNPAIKITPSAPGGYATLTGKWHEYDKIVLALGMPARIVPGDHENAGKAAVIYGPLVLALDTALNPDLPNLKRVALAAETSENLRLSYRPDLAKAGEMVFETAGLVGKEGTPTRLYLTPYATAGQDGKSRFEVWIARPGQIAAASGASSLFSGSKAQASREGNVEGDIADDDTDTFRVTYNAQKADEDWFAVQAEKPVTIRRIVFAHGKTFHDGGWFDASGGKPRVQVQKETGGDWETVATLDTYPDTTATNSAGLQAGQKFSATFAPVQAIAIRIVGKPACGDNAAQAFSSCAELQAFAN